MTAKQCAGPIFTLTMQCLLGFFLAFFLAPPAVVQGQQNWTSASQVIQPPSSRNQQASSIQSDLPPAVTSLVKRLNQLSPSRFTRVWTIQQIVDQLNSSGIPTLLDRNGLDDESIDTDDKVQFSKAQLKLGPKLQDALGQLELCWTVTRRGNALVVSSKSSAGEALMTVTYDVTPLSPFGDSDSLVNVMTAVVDPATWDDVGGPGTVQPLEVRGRRLLVVANTYHVQDQVRELLNTVHRTGGSGIAVLGKRRLVSNHGRARAMGSSPIAMPSQPKKRGMTLPDSGSNSMMGGMGGMGMGGGMF